MVDENDLRERERVPVEAFIDIKVMRSKLDPKDVVLQIATDCGEARLFLSIHNDAMRALGKRLIESADGVLKCPDQGPPN